MVRALRRSRWREAVQVFLREPRAACQLAPDDLAAFEPQAQELGMVVAQGQGAHR